MRAATWVETLAGRAMYGYNNYLEAQMHSKLNIEFMGFKSNFVDQGYCQNIQ